MPAAKKAAAAKKTVAKKTAAKKTAAKKTATKRAAAKKQTPLAPWERPDGTITTTEAPEELSDADKQQLLTDWYEAKQQVEKAAKPIIEHEQELRKRVMQCYFPSLQEGTEKTDIGGGWGLKANRQLRREVDEAALPAVAQHLPPGSLDFLVEYKPRVQTENYRTLPDHLRQIFDSCITTKLGAQKLELVPPKEEE